MVSSVLDLYSNNFEKLIEDMKTQMDLIEERFQPPQEEQQRREADRKYFNDMRLELNELRERASNGDEAAARKINEMRQAIEDARSSRDEERKAHFQSEDFQRQIKERLSLVREFVNKKQILRDEFREGLESLLVRDQEDRWLPLDRKIRREHLLSDGRLQGERVDLFKINDEYLDLIDSETSTKIKTILEEYEISLDEKLQKRQSHDEESNVQLMSLFTAGEYEAAKKILSSRLDIQRSVRDTHIKYANEIDLVLPEPLQGIYSSRVQEVGFRQVYRETQVKLAFKKAMAMESLSEDERAQLADLGSDHAEWLERANNDLVKICKKEDGKEELRRLERFEENGGVRPNSRDRIREEDPVRQAFSKRDGEEQRFLEELKNILGEERYREVAPSERRGRNRQGREGFDQERMQEMIKRFDVDGNGEISQEERRRAIEEFRSNGGRGGRGGDGGRGGNSG